MKCKTIEKHGRKVLIAACTLMIGTAMMQSCKDDDDVVLTGQPEWLGNSIYERLQQEGNYTTLLKLIDDVEDNKDVLSKTGSRTLFATDDAGFDAWFKNNNWNVSGYEDLTPVQKKLLLNNSMLDNAYLVELLSNVSSTPPTPGMAMRRTSIADIYDSVPVMKPEEMPMTSYWKELRERNKDIRIFKDNSRAPLIHFLPAFMERNGITDEDLNWLTNHRGKSNKEAWINGAQIINSDQLDRQGIDYDITCKNGYIHKVDRVIEASPSMAEIIHQHQDEMSIWAKLLDKFSAPYLTALDTRDANETQMGKFQRLYNTEDTVYTLHYFSYQSNGDARNPGKLREKDPSGKQTEAQLRFDPAWNSYIYTNSSGQDLHYDAGAMIVPTDSAFNAWWNGMGSDLRMEYGTPENMPVGTIAQLLNVNMLSNFIETVPTKFNNILNDAKLELGVKKENIKHAYMGCNGVVYLVNELFAPAEFSSVMYPATAHPSLRGIIYHAIEDYSFKPYLLNMDQTYSMILPSNDAMIYYVDPNTYGKKSQTLICFKWDDEKQKTVADRYKMTIDDTTGEITVGKLEAANVSEAVVENRLKDLVDQLIVLGDITDGTQEYYKSKGGTFVHVDRSGGNIKLQGGYQVEHNGGFEITDDMIQSYKNGKSILLNAGVPLTAEKSVYQTLYELRKADFQQFYDLMNGGDATHTLFQKEDGGREPAGGSTNNRNVRLFNNYNYTVYVPLNDSVQKLIDDGFLPTWNDYKAQTSTKYSAAAKNSNFSATELADSAKLILQDMILDFVKYHIQDNALAVGGEKVNTEFETMQRNTETDRFYGLKAIQDGTDLTLTDARGQVFKVRKDDGLYNKMCREYWFKGSGNAATLYFVSSAMLHQIDGAMRAKNYHLFNGKKFTKWADVLEEFKNSIPKKQ